MLYETYLVKDFPLIIGGLKSQSHWFESSWYFSLHVCFYPRIFTDLVTEGLQPMSFSF